MSLAFDKLGCFLFVGLGQLLLLCGKTEDQLLVLFLFPLYLRGFLLQLTHHSRRVLGEVLHVLSVFLSNVDKTCVMVQSQIIQKLVLLLFEVVKLFCYFLVVFLQRIMRIQQFIVNLLELSVLLFEFMEFLVHESGFGCSKFLSVLLGSEVDKLVPLDYFGNKVHEQVFFVFGHVQNGIQEFLLSVAVEC